MCVICVIYCFRGLCCACRESALAEMGIALYEGQTVGVMQPKKVTNKIPYSADTHSYWSVQ